MNNLLRLIHLHGGTVEFRTTTDGFGYCSEHPERPEPPAVAEVTALDTPELLACADCLPRAIERAQMAAEDQHDHNPRITVTVRRTEVVVAA